MSRQTRKRPWSAILRGSRSCRIRAAPTQPGFLHRVIGFVKHTEHAVSYGTQMTAVFLKHVLTLVGRPLLVVAGEKRGTFAKFGIEAVPENCASSDLMRAALAAGKGDLAYTAVDNAVAMVEISGIDVVIVSGGEGSQNELLVQPDIKSIKEMGGKLLLVDAVNTAYALQLKMILLLSGMQSGRDYEMKAYGATSLRLEALLTRSSPGRCSVRLHLSLARVRD
jgi:hypothetical protein